MFAIFKVGCHLSAAQGFQAMGKAALSIGANVFQFFTRNPRGGKAKAIDEADVAALLQLMKENDFGPVLAHAPYTLNPCSKEERTREFAEMIMLDDLKRMEYIPGNLYNFHPGSHVGQGAERGISLIIEFLNKVLRPEQRTVVLLETMAGKGSEIGGRFEDIKSIMDGVTLSDKLGVCLDTCHVHDAGYDIVNDLNGVLAQFDEVIGLDKLRAIHLNDSLNPPSAHKDRHARLGEGFIGVTALSRIINHPRLRELPFYLETPNELAGYAEEIALLKAERD